MLLQTDAESGARDSIWRANKYSWLNDISSSLLGKPPTIHYQQQQLFVLCNRALSNSTTHIAGREYVVAFGMNKNVQKFTELFNRGDYGQALNRR